MRVLVVDDEPAFSEPLAERLALRGYETATAQDADAALVELARGPRDLIFLDVGLPGMDGVDLLKILREHYPQTDVVMLSGAGDMGKAVQAMRRGALNWLSKPVGMDGILAECRKAAERAGARQEAARLAEAARWRSLGRVAEGVAHEVNNPLNIMVQAAGLIRDCLEEPEAEALPDIGEVREAVDTIRTQSLRVREITRKLLMVGHGLDPRVGALDVAADVAQVLRLLHERMESAHVRCDVRVPQGEGAPRPLGSAPELQQICLHLLENALDALSDIESASGAAERPGGLITLAASTRRDAQGQDWYDLVVRDNGPGIASDIMPHIFEPFFSTRALQSPVAAHASGGKTLGRYVGLGLAVARSLAHARGGELTAANAADGGAEFCLSLPLAESLGERPTPKVEA
ncbi:hybrid sensor histidine kinase/response regulator [Desulfovibrio desulfuricans]|uniref:hybrid sensor histidine kinase/response regulator n=1 Tax=Desulfovibrio desulfuricans TaxID=876 RepID=UPI001AE8CBEC|nr:response regulator [Desulfovibrio desulfuricans]MDD3685054.1 response regulator [Desulfovibrio desulfuricans]QTO39765.1 response regulator [Desulfovibrio desulfuricans]